MKNNNIINKEQDSFNDIIDNDNINYDELNYMNCHDELEEDKIIELPTGLNIDDNLNDKSILVSLLKMKIKIGLLFLLMKDFKKDIIKIKKMFLIIRPILKVK